MKPHFFLLLAAPTLLCADGLAELRTGLKKLQSDQPLHARVELQTTRSAGESVSPKYSHGTGVMTIETGPKGLTLSWPPEQIRQARQADQTLAADPDAPVYNEGVLSALDAQQAAKLLDYAEPMRLGLENAVLLEDRTDSYQGQPSRLLVIRPDLHLVQELRKSLKTSDAAVKIWLNGDGVPRAMEITARLKFSKFIVSYKVDLHEIWEFQRAGGRLVVTRVVRDKVSDGFGHNDVSHTSATVALLR
jgi:hypothetical protein